MVDISRASGIDLRRLTAGTAILVVAEPYLYELTITYRIRSLVTVNSNDPALRGSPQGQVIQSRLNDSMRPCWIGRGLAMEIRFRNGNYVSPPVTSASVRGLRDDGTAWSYEVF